MPEGRREQTSATKTALRLEKHHVQDNLLQKEFRAQRAHRAAVEAQWPLQDHTAYVLLLLLLLILRPVRKHQTPTWAPAPPSQHLYDTTAGAYRSAFVPRASLRFLRGFFTSVGGAAGRFCAGFATLRFIAF
jgi:hypothetical protein